MGLSNQKLIEVSIILSKSSSLNLPKDSSFTMQNLSQKQKTTNLCEYSVNAALLTDYFARASLFLVFEFCVPLCLFCSLDSMISPALELLVALLSSVLFSLALSTQLFAQCGGSKVSLDSSKINKSE
jgi:DMSO reductase anchor subunit